jgi:ketosteroid isomerase-like protein
MSKTDSQSRAEIIRAMFAAADGGDMDGQLNFLTDDVVLVFGNADAVLGKDAIKTQASEFLATLKGVRHEIHEMFHAAEDADVLIALMTVHYSRLDGSVVSLPCCNVFRMTGDLVADYRIYMDVNPVFKEESRVGNH